MIGWRRSRQIAEDHSHSSVWVWLFQSTVRCEAPWVYALQPGCSNPLGQVISKVRKLLKVDRCLWPPGWKMTKIPHKTNTKHVATCSMYISTLARPGTGNIYLCHHHLYLQIIAYLQVSRTCSVTKILRLSHLFSWSVVMLGTSRPCRFPTVTLGVQSIPREKPHQSEQLECDMFLLALKTCLER